MPTTLPTRRTPPRADYIFIFLLALAVSFFVIEMIDPAPMDVEAALMDAAP